MKANKYIGLELELSATSSVLFSGSLNSRFLVNNIRCSLMVGGKSK